MTNQWPTSDQMVTSWWQAVKTRGSRNTAPRGMVRRAGGSWGSSQLCKLSNSLLAPAAPSCGQDVVPHLQQHPRARKSCTKHSLRLAQIPPGALQPLGICQDPPRVFPGGLAAAPGGVPSPRGPSTRRRCCKNGAHTAPKPARPELPARC